MSYQVDKFGQLLQHSENGIVTMVNLTDTDRRLLDVLSRDSRASVTTLAGRLGVSRATVQTRLKRLLETGVIRRFTVEVDPAVQLTSVRAVMMIAIEGTLARSVIRALNRLDTITSLHTTNGAWDLVAHVETASLPEFDRVLREVREIKGVLNSQTSLLLDTAKG